MNYPTLDNLTQLARTAKSMGLMDNLRPAELLGLVGLTRRPSMTERALDTAATFVAGAAVGAGAALLISPIAGEELRSKLGALIDQARQNLEKAGGELRDSMSSAVESRSPEAAEAAVPMTH